MSMQVILKKVDGQSEVYRVNPTDTLNDFKTQIKDKQNLARDRIALVYLGKSLDTEEAACKTLAQLKIKNGSNVFQIVKVTGGTMQIFVKTVDGKSELYVVSPSDSVRDLKMQIKDKQNIAVESISLVFMGKSLDTEEAGCKTLAQLGIKNKANIFQILKVRGGSRECVVCCEEKPDNEAHFPKFASGCAHESTICAPCIAQTIKPDIEEKASAEVVCMTCKAELDGEDIARHGTLDMLSRWEHNAFKKYTLQHPCFRYCSKPGCGNGEIYEQGAQYPKIRCTKCRTAGCFNHFGVGKSCQPWHEGKSCQEYDDWLASQPPEAQAEHFMKVNTKPCPKCYSPIIKNCTMALPCFGRDSCKVGSPCLQTNGCDHITCVCKAEWCWVCLEIWPRVGGQLQPKHRPNCSHHGNTSAAIFAGSLSAASA